MRLNIVKQLFMNNLLYVNPMNTNKFRKKSNGKYDIRKKIFRSTVFANAFIPLIFISTFFNSEIIGNPDRYKLLIIIFSTFTYLILTPSVVNMFYESKDTLKLLHLPISEKELFASKFIALIWQTFGNVITIFIINFLAMYFWNQTSILKILIVLVYSIALLLCIYCGFILLISQIKHIPNFEKNRSKINGILIFISIALAISYGFLSTQVPKDSIQVDSNYKGNFFYNILAKNDTTSYLNLAIIVAIALVLLFLLNLLVVKPYFSDIHKLAKVERVKLNDKQMEKVTKSTSLTKKLIKRNIRLFSDGTLIAQVFSSCSFGLIFLISSAIAIRKNELLNLEFNFSALGLSLGSCFVLLVFTMLSFSGVAISLEKETYYQLRALPLDFKHYLKIKLTTAYLFQIALVVPFLTGILIFMKASFIFICFSILSFLISNISYTLFSATSDFKNLHLTWTEVSQLITRTRSNGFTVFLLFLITLLIAIINGLTYFLLYTFPSIRIILIGIYFLIILIILALCYIRFKNNVLNKIN